MDELSFRIAFNIGGSKSRLKKKLRHQDSSRRNATSTGEKRWVFLRSMYSLKRNGKAIALSVLITLLSGMEKRN